MAESDARPVEVPSIPRHAPSADLQVPGALGPGAALREAREARGLSIADLTRSTKISRAMLLALEENQVEKLPARIFTRGFLKAYAHEVGLDPDTTADHYLARLQPEPVGLSDAETAHVNNPATRTEVLALDDDTDRVIAAQQARRFGRLMTVAAVFGLAAYVGAFNWLRPSSPEPAATEVAAGGGGEAPAAQTAVPSDPTPAVAFQASTGPLKIELRPQGPCWVLANVDGNPAFARLLQAGDVQTIEAREEIVLRVGDPATFSFFISGQPGRPLGRAGEPVTIRITKENFREFVSVSS